MADSQTRHSRGLIIVIALAVLFFTLLALIVLRSDDRPRRVPELRETLTVLPIRIRIRTEPNAKAPVVATATTGENVTMVEDRGAWVRVTTGEGLVGWAERANLEKVAERERRAKRYAAIRNLPPLKGVATDDTPLYSGPGIFYPLVGELSDGTDVTVYTRDADFFAIRQGNGIAYADVDAIDISSSGTQFDVRTASMPATDTVTEEQPTVTDTAIADTAVAEPPPFEAPEPEPVPEPSRAPALRSGGVYAAVPAGGTQPRELERAVPRYPNAARRAGVEGAVVVRGIVRRDGTIDDVEIIKDLPHGLGEEARRAVRRWRFRPATYLGEPIDVYYTVTVNFRLN